MPEIAIFERLRGGESLVEPLDAFILRLTKIRDKIPKDKQPTATVEIWPYGDYAGVYADVHY